MVQWADLDLEKLHENEDETLLSKAVAAVENGYRNAAGGFSRYPGLTQWSDFPSSRTYLHPWRDELVAATDKGRVYRISKLGTATDVTGVPISGGKRVTFADTEDQVVMAAGGPIVSLSGRRTTLLSRQAPDSTHVGYLQGYLMAIEPQSQRFSISLPGDYTHWDAGDVFSANSKPSKLIALAVSPYSEIMFAKKDSIEQYELLANGLQPFARRWSTGEGVAYPYTLIADKTGTYGVNDRFEFVRFTGQVSTDQSADIGLRLEKIDDWTDAWAQELAVKGQKTIILQMPMATNVHGTKGVTFSLDYRARQWSQLFGWDAALSMPTRFPAWSVARAWGKVYCGVPGGIAVFDDDSYSMLGGTYPFLVRSGHIAKFGPSRIDDMRIRLRRGAGAYAPANPPRIGMRVNRDENGFDRWQFEPLGPPGERTTVIHFGGQGAANTWQFEFAVTDDVPVEIVGGSIYVERLKW